MRQYEDVVTTKHRGIGKGTDEEETDTHPSFGQIRCSRVSGRTALYGSDFVHDHYMTVAICPSETRRSLSHDWPYAKQPIIEIAMSESQWAQFISTPNSGQGTRCTITDLHGKPVPQIPEPKRRDAQFRAEMVGKVHRAQREIAALRTEVEGLKISGAAKKTLTDRIWQAEMATSSSIEFVQKSFDEHIERTVDQAKTEVEAYIEARIHAAGLSALGIGKLVELPGPSTDRALTDGASAEPPIDVTATKEDV